MVSRARRLLVLAGLVCGGGYVLAGPGTSCSSYMTESTFTALDFCFIFDCQNGLWGGTVDPCSSAGAWLVDCPTDQ